MRARLLIAGLDRTAAAVAFCLALMGFCAVSVSAAEEPATNVTPPTAPAPVTAPVAAGNETRRLDASRLFQEALICYGELNFACARQKLEAARERAEPTKERELRLGIARYLALTCVALGDEAGAKANFKRMLDIDERVRPAPREVSPKVLAIFEAAERERREERKALPPLVPLEVPVPPPENLKPPVPEKTKPEPVEPKPEPEKPSPPKFMDAAELRLGPAFLFGREERRYGAGINAGAGLRLLLGKTPWFAGPQVEYQVHPGSSKSKLHVLQALGEAGYLLDLGRVDLALPVGVGAAAYGRDGLGDEIALCWRFHPGLLVRVADRAEIGFGVGPQGVVLLNRAASSTYLAADVRGVLLW